MVFLARIRNSGCTSCLSPGLRSVTRFDNQTSQAFGSWRVRWRGVPNLGLSPMLQRLSSMWREISHETVNAVRRCAP
jgi:hypothetical protein